MVLIGGLCFVLIGSINEFLSCSPPKRLETPLSVQMLIAACIVTAVEFVAGLVLNVYLVWNVWNYSHLPLNLYGQVCLLYFALWYALSWVIKSAACYFYIANEGISIIENAALLGLPVPKKLVDVLAQIKGRTAMIKIMTAKNNSHEYVTKIKL